jgi:hypothetical protein
MVEVVKVKGADLGHAEIWGYPRLALLHRA